MGIEDDIDHIKVTVDSLDDDVTNVYDLRSSFVVIGKRHYNLAAASWIEYVSNMYASDYGCVVRIGDEKLAFTKKTHGEKVVREICDWCDARTLCDGDLIS